MSTKQLVIVELDPKDAPELTEYQIKKGYKYAKAFVQNGDEEHKLYLLDPNMMKRAALADKPRPAAKKAPVKKAAAAKKAPAKAEIKK